MSACVRQTAASHPKFAFTLTFIFCSPICPDNCGVVFLWKYIFVFRQTIFFVRPLNYEIFTLNITRVVWPHVTNLLDLRYFCQHNPLFYHLNLIPCHYWSWQSNIYFLVNIFVQHTFSDVDRYDRIYWARERERAGESGRGRERTCRHLRWFYNFPHS